MSGGALLDDDDGSKEGFEGFISLLVVDCLLLH